MKFLLFLLFFVVAGYFYVTQKQRIETLEGELAAANAETAELQQTVDKLRATAAVPPAPMSTALAPPPRPTAIATPVPLPSPNASWMWQKTPMDTPQKSSAPQKSKKGR